MKHEVHLPQGTIRYRDEGSGDPLLFVHGVVVNGDLWRKVVPPLAKDFRCIVPDWPLGSHSAPMRADADLSPPGLARLIADFVEALELDSVVLVGNDTGGALAQIVAAEHPDRVRRLVLASCDVYERFFPPVFKPFKAAGFVPGSIWLMGQALRARRVQRLPVAFGWVAKRHPDPETIESYLGPGRASRGIRRDLHKVLRGVDPRHTLAAAEKLAAFRRPVLLAWATEDRLFPVEYARRLAASLPDATLEEIEDSYTFVPEDQPERLADAIAAFVRRPDAVSA